MLIIPILFIIALVITGWVAYYTATSVYRSLKKNDSPYARVIQVFTGLIMFVALMALAGYFILSGVSLER
jgi:SNF family Na+-dependent transporter